MFQVFAWSSWIVGSSASATGLARARSESFIISPSTVADKNVSRGTFWYDWRKRRWVVLAEANALLFQFGPNIRHHDVCRGNFVFHRNGCGNSRALAGDSAAHHV